MQTNNTTKAVKTVKNAGNFDTLGDPSADAIRDEMIRMLDNLPENAIVKSHKAGGKKQANMDAVALTSQGQTSQQQSASGINIKKQGSEDQPKQLQARTQKIDLKFDSQHRIDGLMNRVLKQTGASKPPSKAKVSKEGLPPKNLVVNRLAVTKKDAAVMHGAETASGFV